MQLSLDFEAAPPSASPQMTQADHVRHTVLAALSARTQWSIRSFRLAVDTAINEAGITRRDLAKALGLSLSMVARAVDVTDRRISCVRAVAKALGYDASDDRGNGGVPTSIGHHRCPSGSPHPDQSRHDARQGDRRWRA